MFIGDSTGKIAEIRPPSLKGVLRYWWRALNGDLDPKVLYGKEMSIFGGSDENHGKSKVTIKIFHNLKQYSISELPKTNLPSYTSFGLRVGTKELERGYIPTKKHFSFSFNYSEKLDDGQINEIETALAFVAMVGGIGSKSRNGYGRFNIENLKLKIDDLINEIKNHSNKELSSYCAFSKETKIFRTKSSFNSWLDVLTYIDQIYKSAKTSLNDNRKYIASSKNHILYNKQHYAKSIFLSVVKNSENKYDGYVFVIPYNVFIAIGIRNYNSELANYKAAISAFCNNLINNGLIEI